MGEKKLNFSRTECKSDGFIWTIVMLARVEPNGQLVQIPSICFLKLVVDRYRSFDTGV